MPVGQGAFYLEQFKLDSGKINVVYDCGSDTSVNLIKRQIDDVFDPGEEVHAVFISHFDMDHINGIEHLLKHCRVRHIFFPLVTRKAIPLLLLNCFCKSGKADPENFVFRFIEDPIQAVENIHHETEHKANNDSSTSLHPVLPYPGEGRHRDAEYDEYEELYRHESRNFRPMQSGDSADRLIMDGAHDELSEYLQWQYIPFNFKQEERVNRLTDALRYEFGDSCDPKDLVDRCIKNQPSLIKSEKLIMQFRALIILILLSCFPATTVVLPFSTKS